MAQNRLLYLGNSAPILVSDDSSNITERLNDLPSSLEKYDAIFLFSGAVSILSNSQIDDVLSFVSEGKGLYCGADNAPLVEEFNLISNQILNKRAWGNFNNSNAVLADQSFLTSIGIDSIYAGETTVAIPLDVRVKVEAWAGDEPIITSLSFGRGRIVFDGGYSRFHKMTKMENMDVFESIINYLVSKN